MSLSDCPKCWSTPCECGYEYRNWSKDHRIDMASIILGIPKSRLDQIIFGIPEKHPMWVKEEERNNLIHNKLFHSILGEQAPGIETVCPNCHCPTEYTAVNGDIPIADDDITCKICKQPLTAIQKTRLEKEIVSRRLSGRVIT